MSEYQVRHQWQGANLLFRRHEGTKRSYAKNPQFKEKIGNFYTLICMSFLYSLCLRAFVFNFFL